MQEDHVAYSEKQTGQDSP